jgi:hypothetical protein
LITRSIEVLETRTRVELVSRCFTAKFADGTEKVLTTHVWQYIGLRKDCETGIENTAYLSAETCPLYRKDWSNKPILELRSNA